MSYIRQFDGSDDMVRWGDGTWIPSASGYTFGVLARITGDLTGEQVICSLNLDLTSLGPLYHASVVALGVDSNGDAFLQHDAYDSGPRVTMDMLNDPPALNFQDLHSVIGDYWVMLAATYDASNEEAGLYVALPEFAYVYGAVSRPTPEFPDELLSSYPWHTGGIPVEVWAGGDQLNYTTATFNERPAEVEIATVFWCDEYASSDDLSSLWDGTTSAQDEWGTAVSDLSHLWNFSQDDESTASDDLIGSLDQIGRVGTVAIEEDPYVPYVALAPDVTTQAATTLTYSGATLNGTINPGGLSTDYVFQYGLTESYGQVAPIPAGTVPASYDPSPVSQPILGLTPGTTYHFRLVSTNAIDTTEGGDMTFQTQALTMPEGHAYTKRVWKVRFAEDTNEAIAFAADSETEGDIRLAAPSLSRSEGQFGWEKYGNVDEFNVIDDSQAALGNAIEVQASGAESGFISISDYIVPKAQWRTISVWVDGDGTVEPVFETEPDDMVYLGEI